MDGLILLANGVCAGFLGNEVYLSEPFMPYAWNPDYTLAVDHPVVALASFDTAIVVMTNAYPYIVDCYDPMSATIRRINEPLPCLSLHSVTTGNGFIAYASTWGFYRISANGAENLTKALFTPEQWAALDPSTMICRYYESKFYFFKRNAATGFILDLTSSVAAYIPFTLTNTVLNAHVSVNPQGLFLLTITSGSVLRVERWEYATTSTRKSASYSSRLHRLDKPINFSCARVYGNQTVSNPVTFFLYGNTVKIYEKTVTDDEPFWLPDGSLYDEIYVKMTFANAKVTGWALATSVEELGVG